MAPVVPEPNHALQSANEQVLRLEGQARQLAQEKAALQRRAEAAEARVLERDAAVRQADERIAELQRHSREREAALQRQATAAEERSRQLALQLEQAQQELERAQQGERIPDVRPVAQALSGGICTASFAELAAATRDFAAGSILGRGGFGPVYRGEWGGQAVAIKRLDQASPSPLYRVVPDSDQGDLQWFETNDFAAFQGASTVNRVRVTAAHRPDVWLGQASLQGLPEFLREVTVLGVYRHPHIVPLLSFSLSRREGQQEACLVYPLMARGGLDQALAARAAHPLDAAARLRIAADVAAGLAFLHGPGAGLAPMLHRDVKSSNVLLDGELRARVSDVGLARPQSGATMTAGVGTFGYIDPEYFATGERSYSDPPAFVMCR